MTVHQWRGLSVSGFTVYAPNTLSAGFPVCFFNISQRGGVIEEEDTQWGTKLEEKVSSVLRPTHPILLKGI